MEGFLLPPGGRWDQLLYFLLPHSLSLFLVPLIVKGEFFEHVSKAALIATVLLTLLFQFFEGSAKVLLVAIGILSVFLLFIALDRIRVSTNPPLSAAVGIAVGNLLVFLLSRAPLDPRYKYFVIAFFLFSSLFLEGTGGKETEKEKIPIPAGYLVLLFTFYLTGGLLYGLLMPLYEKTSLFKGGELFFYIGAVVPAVALVRKEWDLPVIAAIFLGAVSFSLLQMHTPVPINLGMFASQASFSLMDFFTVLLVVGIGSRKAFGFGFGTVCMAIAAGKLLCLQSEGYTAALVAAGNVVLIGATLCLYRAGKKQGGKEFFRTVSGVLRGNGAGTGNGRADAPGGSGEFDRERLDGILGKMYEPHQKRLSAQEQTVLLWVLEGKTYRGAAKGLGISESSVKTYMRRICEKFGCDSRERLIGMFEETGHTSEEGHPRNPGGTTAGSVGDPKRAGTPGYGRNEYRHPQ